MDTQKLNILGISEMRWLGTGDFWSDNYTIINSGTKDGRAGMKGVGIILEKSLGHRVTGYIQHSESIILVKLNTKPSDTIIIQVYMPTSNEEDEEINRLYDELNNLIDKSKGEDNVIVLGYMNANIGEEKKGTIVGQYGLGVKNEQLIVE